MWWRASCEGGCGGGVVGHRVREVLRMWLGGCTT